MKCKHKNRQTVCGGTMYQVYYGVVCTDCGELIYNGMIGDRV